jgi:hypothetical protein
MAQFEVQSCSYDDGRAIAEVQVSAFWTDPTWVIIWPGKTLEYVIAQYARRIPHTLHSERAHRRHQKIVELETNKVVGYARWTLPELSGIDMEDFWPTARVPDVTKEKEVDSKAEYLAANFDFDRSLDELDRPLDEIMSGFLEQKKYAGKFAHTNNTDDEY